MLADSPFLVLRSVNRESAPSKALATDACRVESRTCRSGEMADALDSKSSGRKAVWVRLPPPAPPSQLSRRRPTSSILQVSLVELDSPERVPPTTYRLLH